MRAFILGNGKSLLDCDLNRLDKFQTYTCNRIGLIYGRTFFRPKVYVHPESLDDDLSFIQENIDLGIECHIGERYGEAPRGIFGIKEAPNVHWIKDCHHWYLDFDSPALPDEWCFQPCTFAGSVNYMMQLAIKQGYDDIILVGCDLEYKDGKDDPSHFDPRYKNGKEKPAWLAAKNALWGHIQAMNYLKRKHLNVRVRNATHGGLLEVWERVSFDDVSF
jgi:hypothetical protein